MTTATGGKSKAAPPRLHFDDGSRIMMENQVELCPETPNSPSEEPAIDDPSLIRSGTRTNTDDYLIEQYELDRITQEIISTLDLEPSSDSDSQDSDSEPGDFDCRIALQFPDHLLHDSPRVSQLLGVYLDDYNPLIFVCGDTTAETSSCCVDEITALHLNADLVVHFGTPACLSPTTRLPVIYSFGGLVCLPCGDGGGGDGGEGLEGEGQEFWKDLLRQMEEPISELEPEGGGKRVLVLFDVLYTAMMPLLKQCLLADGQQWDTVLLGGIPATRTKDFASNDDDDDDTRLIIIGGLEVRLSPGHTLKDYVVLYISQPAPLTLTGDADAESPSWRQLVNIMMRCTPGNPGGAQQCWAYTPPAHDNNPSVSTAPTTTVRGTFTNDASRICSRQLARRYYLIQKAKMASIFGIVINTLNISQFTTIVSQLQSKLHKHDRHAYTLVISKLNVAKLTNFAEIETFVLVGCSLQFSGLLDNREFHVPVITPYELGFVLEEREWGVVDGTGREFFYSCEFSDFLTKDAAPEATIDLLEAEDTGGNKTKETEIGDNGSDTDDSDAPYFSMISGQYETRKKKITSTTETIAAHTTTEHTTPDNDTDTADHGQGQGQLIEYHSASADYLKQREYMGLQSNIGKDEVKPIVMGQTGIASDYGQRL